MFILFVCLFVFTTITLKYKSRTNLSGQGHYITMAHHTVISQKATLESQNLNTGVAYCLQLWYMIPTASSGKLVIYREVDSFDPQDFVCVCYSLQ